MAAIDWRAVFVGAVIGVVLGQRFAHMHPAPSVNGGGQ